MVAQIFNWEAEYLCEFKPSLADIVSSRAATAYEQTTSPAPEAQRVPRLHSSSWDFRISKQPLKLIQEKLLGGFN